MKVGKLFGIFVLAGILGSACNDGHSSLEDDGSINPNGQVILFYRDGASLVIKQCEDFSVLKTRDDCKTKADTTPAQVEVDLFRKHLLTIVRLSDPATFSNPDIARKIDVYKKDDQLGNTPDLEASRQTLAKQLEKIKAFTAEYGENSGDPKLQSDLEAKLKEVEQKLADKSDLTDAVQSLNKLVNALVDQIISNPKMTIFSYAKNNGQLFFNVLASYVRNPEVPLGEFVRIPKTKDSFMMGSPDGEAGHDDNEKQHPVKISYDFYMSQTETTQAEWFDVMGDNPAHFSKKENCPSDHVDKEGIPPMCPNHPVENVSWYAVQVFIEKLNKRGAVIYRLPTEAEWEYAARAGTTTAYNLGETITKDKVNFGGMQTVAVGSLKNANNWLLSDMHGNVYEWASDWYDEKYYNNSPETDPKGPQSGSSRVLRGGGWFSFRKSCRSAFRLYTSPEDRDINLGFRLVKD